MLIVALTFDAVWGIQFLYTMNSLTNFLDNMKMSLSRYGNKNATFGVLPVPVEVYWDHFQEQVR